MALNHCHFYSETLGQSTSMYVILPQAVKRKKHPVLYLLHGLSDDHTIWMRRTSIERYVAPLGLAVIMPEVGRSYYADMHRGLRYWTFISEELPKIARSFFPLSDARKDSFAAGLSMGGYGAFKLALSQPERFAAAASLSGAVDAHAFLSEQLRNRDAARISDVENIFGKVEDIPGSANDLFELSGRLKRSGKKIPALFQSCGTEDFLLKDNRRFRNHLKNLRIPVRYGEHPGGHTWDCWDKQIQAVLSWLPLSQAGD